MSHNYSIENNFKILKLFQVIGLIPFSIKIREPSNKKSISMAEMAGMKTIGKIRITKTNFMLFYVFLVIIIILINLWFAMQRDDLFQEIGKMTTFIDRLSFYVNQLVMIIVLVELIAKIDIHINLLKKLIKVNKNVLKLNGRTIKNHVGYNNLFVIKKLAYLVTVYVVGQICLCLINSYLLFYWAYLFHNSFTSFMYNFHFLQIIFYLLMIRQIFHLFMSYIERSCDQFDTAAVGELVTNTTNHFYNDATKLNLIKNYERILIIKNLYLEIYEIVDLFNKCFGISLIAMTSANIINLIANIYWFIIVHSKHVGKPFWLAPFALTVYHANLIYCVIRLCGDCKDMAQIIFSRVKNIQFCRKPLYYQSLIRRLILQLNNQPIIFTANNFFNLDFETLASIFGSVSMYVLVMIQFDMTAIQGNDSYFV